MQNAILSLRGNFPVSIFAEILTDDDDVEAIFECPACNEIFGSESDLAEHKTSTHEAAAKLIVQAPKIIAKHTARQAQKELKESTMTIPEAPKFVAKKTGGGVPKRPANDPYQDPTPSTSTAAEYEGPSTSSNASTTGRATRRSTGAISTVSYDEEQMLPDLGFESVTLPFALPPPLPIVEPEMMMYRGESLPATEVARRIANSNHNGKASGAVKKYNYRPFVTITGKSKPSTVDAAEREVDGEFVCPHAGCGNVYARLRSLESHIKRIHKVYLGGSQCPHCGKRLSSQNAIRKHLLSHRPKEEWPFTCVLCKSRFQAKGDLPKHLMTNLHKNDSLPPIGSPQWIDLINRGVDHDLVALMRENGNRVLRGEVVGHLPLLINANAPAEDANNFTFVENPLNSSLVPTIEVVNDKDNFDASSDEEDEEEEVDEEGEVKQNDHEKVKKEEESLVQNESPRRDSPDIG